MTTPVKMQFAFQGGGARIAALLAVAEAIQDFKADHKIEVTQVAGTSAGAIVASFVAAGISAQSIMAELRGGKGAQLMRGMTMPGKLAAAYCLLVKSKSLRDTAGLRGWLNDKFAHKKLAKVGDVERRGVRLKITKTDLGSRDTVLAQPGETLADALVDSCALPFFFRIWAGSTAPTVVDGGISNNLPAKLLTVSDPAYGEMLAITFAEAATDRPDGFLSFSASLLDSAMASTIALTKEAFKGHLIEVQTSLTTFSFEQALAPEFEAEYERIKEDTARQLQEHINRITLARRRAVTNPWKETNPTAVRMMRDVGELYFKLRGGLLHYDSCRLTVYTNGGRPVGDQHAGAPDLVQFHLQIRTGAEALHCLSIGLTEQSDEAAFSSETARCTVTGPGGERPDFLQLAMQRAPREAGNGDRELCLFFTPALPAGSGPYSIDFQENGTDLMIELFKTHADAIGFYPQRADGVVGRVELVLFAHEDLQLLLTPEDPERPGRVMTEAEIRALTPIPVFPNMRGWGMALDNARSAWSVAVHHLH
jgi:NTE family protein